MTDRGRAALTRSDHGFRVGPSRMVWDGQRLVVDIDEVSSPPIISRVRGRIVITPSAVTGVQLELGQGHIWRPFAPVARIEVDLTQGHRWTGHGYFDANFGDSALERDFRFWTWGRYPTKTGATCFYDAERADGSMLAQAIRFTPDGQAEQLANPPPLQPFKRTLWAVRRETRGDTGCRPHQVMSMLDAPFYSRSVVETVLDGEVCHGVHEALDLRRFAQPLLMPMLAVRVPRRAGWPSDAG